MERKFMKEKITPELINDLRSKINEGVPSPEIRKWFRDQIGLQKSRANEIYSDLVKNLGNINNYGIKIVSDRYVYNEENDTYIINLKFHAKPFVISGAKHRAICRAYSNWGEDMTANEICRKFSITPEIFNEYRTIFKLDKTREPLSAEEVLEEPVERSVSQILEERRYKIFQEFEKESWKRTQQDAIKWQTFQAKSYDPFAILLENWTPPKYEKVKLEVDKKQSDEVLLINIADIHVGAKADERYLYRQNKWDISDLTSAMADYSDKLANLIAKRNSNFLGAVVTIGGDIIHTLTGYTDKGTKLEYEFLEENQIDFAFNILVLFLESALRLFPTISVKSVSGNHSSVGDYVIAKMLECYFRNEKRLYFEVSTKRYLPFKINNSLFILDHGASAKGVKSKLPRRGCGRDSYIQSILLAKPEMLVGVKQKYFITNDKHHFEYEEKTDFEMIMCPSIVGGDKYSDLLGFSSRPSQCVFVVGDEGITEIVKLYFD